LIAPPLEIPSLKESEVPIVSHLLKSSFSKNAS